MVAPAGSPVTLKLTLPVFPVRARVTAALALEPSGTVSVEMESWSVMPLVARDVTGAVPASPPQPMNESERQRAGRSGTGFFTGRAPQEKVWIKARGNDYGTFLSSLSSLSSVSFINLQCWMISATYCTESRVPMVSVARFHGVRPSGLRCLFTCVPNLRQQRHPPG